HALRAGIRQSGPYADPELMDGISKDSWFLADKSTAYLQFKPARKHLQKYLKRPTLAHSGSKRIARLRHRRPLLLAACARRHGDVISVHIQNPVHECNRDFSTGIAKNGILLSKKPSHSGEPLARSSPPLRLDGA